MKSIITYINEAKETSITLKDLKNGETFIYKDETFIVRGVIDGKKGVSPVNNPTITNYFNLATIVTKTS